MKDNKDLGRKRAWKGNLAIFNLMSRNLTERNMTHVKFCFFFFFLHESVKLAFYLMANVWQ